MKKLKYSLIALAVIIILLFVSMRVMGLSFSQEKVQQSMEQSMHYGPSDEVLYKYTGPDGRGIVISRCGDEGLSVTRTSKVLGFLYKAGDRAGEGTSGYYDCPNKINVWYDRDIDMVFGMGSVINDQLDIEMGNEKSVLLSFDAHTDDSGFFLVTDLQSINDVKYPGDDYYKSSDIVYAELIVPTDDDIRDSSLMTKGVLIYRADLNDIMPDYEGFLKIKDTEGQLSGDELNVINAGIKEYTGVDFFATSGYWEDDKLVLKYSPRPWSDKEMKLTMVKSHEGIALEPTDENMDAVCRAWIRMNYGFNYGVGNIHSKAVSVTEKDGKKYYDTFLSCGLADTPSKVDFVEEAENDEDYEDDDSTEEIFIEVVLEADTDNPFSHWKLYYKGGFTNELRDIEELSLRKKASIFDLSVQDLMSAVTENRIVIEAVTNVDAKTAAKILNNAAPDTVNEAEALEKHLDPEVYDFDSRPWSCTLYLLDYGESEDVLNLNHLFPSNIELFCNRYSEYVCAIVTDHYQNKKIEYFNDKDLYEMVRHFSDPEEIVDQEAYQKYKDRLDKHADYISQYLEEDFGWKGHTDLIRFEKQWEFEASDKSGTIELYRFDYAFTLDDFSKFNGGAGGMHLDGDMRMQGMGGGYGQLAIKLENGKPVDWFYIGNDWGVDTDSTDEGYIKEMRETIENGLRKKSNWE